MQRPGLYPFSKKNAEDIESGFYVEIKYKKMYEHDISAAIRVIYGT